MSIAAYYHGVLPYYNYPELIGEEDDEDTEEMAATVASLPSVQSLYSEYKRLVRSGYTEREAFGHIRNADPEASGLVEFLIQSRKRKDVRNQR